MNLRGMPTIRWASQEACGARDLFSLGTLADPVAPRTYWLAYTTAGFADPFVHEVVGHFPQACVRHTPDSLRAIEFNPANAPTGAGSPLAFMEE